MNGKPLIHRFTPSRTPPEVLEQIFVQRQHLLADTLDRMRDSVAESNKHHFLFVGPRGSGKSHLISLIAHRVSQDKTLRENIRVAWLDEDETTISFLDLLLRIHRALSQAYPDEFSDREMDALFDLSVEDASRQMRSRLLKQLGDRTLVVLAENLDKLFAGLGAEGQKRWRAFMQESGVAVTVATSQRLFDDIRKRSKPFFGQFQVEHLSPLNLEEAVELLRHISLYHSDRDLAAFLNTSRGRSRVQAIYHLSGGNHRVFIILSEFISRQALDELVVAFEKLLDELTPYYQERIGWLPAQQRKLVEYLCRCEGPVPVKEMARRLFMSHQTASRQLKELRDKGYVISHSRGRESLYELGEPLMRLCVEVKENRGQTIPLVVRFLRAWYTDDELRQFEKSRIGASYVEAALGKFEGASVKSSTPPHGEGPTSLSAKALMHLRTKDFSEAVAELTKVITSTENIFELANALVNRGYAYGQLGDSDKEMADYTAVLEMEDATAEQKAKALVNRGLRYSQLGDSDKEMADYTAVLEMEDAPAGQKAQALFNRGVRYGQLGDSDKAMADFTSVLEMEDATAGQKAKALVNRGYWYGQLGDWDEAMADFTSVLEMEYATAEQKAKALVNRGLRYGQLGDSDKAMADFTAVLEMEDATAEQKARAVDSRGVLHYWHQEHSKALSAFDDAILLDPNNRVAHFNRIEILMHLGRWGDAFDALKHTLAAFPPASTGDAGDSAEMVRIIAKQAPAEWNDLVLHILDIYRTADALEFLGKGLVGSLAELEIPVGLLDEWLRVWEEACKDTEQMRVPMRIFRVGVRYLRPDDRGGADARLLYDLHKEEADILRQVLRIESPDG